MKTYMNSYQRRKHKTNVLARKSSKPYRCVVYRSNRFIYAQLIDQNTGNILVAATDMTNKSGTKMESAKNVGKLFGEQLKDKKLTDVVFDRNGFLYHGRIAALCDGIREAGIII